MTAVKTELERQVLSLHAVGLPIEKICNRLGRTSREVNEVLTRLSRYDRNEAARLLATESTASATSAAPASGSGDLEAMLTRATAAEDPRARKLAGRIRALVDELAAILAHAEHEAAIRAKIADLHKQLDDARQQLRATKTAMTCPVPVPDPSEVSEPAAAAAATPSQIRAWAAAHNIPCPAKGVIPRVVRQAYEDTHPGSPS